MPNAIFDGLSLIDSVGQTILATTLTALLVAVGASDQPERELQGVPRQTGLTCPRKLDRRGVSSAPVRSSRAVA